MTITITGLGIAVSSIESEAAALIKSLADDIETTMNNVELTDEVTELVKKLKGYYDVWSDEWGGRLTGTTTGTISSTTLTVASGTGLAVGQYIPVGTDLFNVTSYGLQFTGSTVATAVTATSSTSQAITVTAVATAVPAGGTVALVQTPECLVKTNFNVHRYNIV